MCALGVKSTYLFIVQAKLLERTPIHHQTESCWSRSCLQFCFSLKVKLAEMCVPQLVALWQRGTHVVRHRRCCPWPANERMHSAKQLEEQAPVDVASARKQTQTVGTRAPKLELYHFSEMSSHLRHFSKSPLHCVKSVGLHEVSHCGRNCCAGGYPLSGHRPTRTRHVFQRPHEPALGALLLHIPQKLPVHHPFTVPHVI